MGEPALTPRRKMALVVRVWARYLPIALRERRGTLPEQVDIIERAAGRRSPRASSGTITPVKVSRAIHYGLRLGPVAPRCLPKAMVMYQILLEEGVDAQLVIGLPEGAGSHIAHAWVEVDGEDVGPPPGRGGRHELMRFPVKSG